MKIVRNLLFLVVLLSVSILLPSCGNSISSRLDKIVSDEADLVIVGDLQRALKELDFEQKDGKVRFPSYLMTPAQNVGHSLVAKLDVLADVVSEFDLENAILVGKLVRNGVNTLFCIDIKDPEALCNKLNMLGAGFFVKEVEGYKLVGNENQSIIVDGHTAYILSENEEALRDIPAIRELERWLEAADKTPLAAWKKDYLTQESVASVWFAGKNLKVLKDYDSQKIAQLEQMLPGVKIENSSFGALLNLDGSSLRANVSFFDGDKVMKCPVGGEIDTELLKYTDDTDIAVVMMSFNEFSLKMMSAKMLEVAKAQLDYLQEVYDEYGIDYDDTEFNQVERLYDKISEALNNLDGTIMFAAGFAGGATLSEVITDPDKNNHILVAVKCKNGKATSLMNDLVSYAREADARVTSISNGYKIENDGVPANVIVDGNNLIISSGNVLANGGKNFNKDLFKNSWLGAQVKVDPSQSLVKKYNLPFGVEASLNAENMSFNVDVTLDGVKGNIIPVVANTLVSVLSILQN